MQILKGLDRVLLRFCYRETNSVADFMAKLGAKMQPDEEKFFRKCVKPVLNTLLVMICRLYLVDGCLRPAMMYLF